jgi:hypothetical protein
MSDVFSLARNSAPALRVVNDLVEITDLGSTGEQGHLTSHRISCSKDGRLDAQAACIDIKGFYVREDFYRLSRSIAPFLATNPEDAERVLLETDNSNSAAAVKAVCKRLGNLSAPCKVLIELLPNNLEQRSIR